MIAESTILERHNQLDELEDALGSARAGTGGVVLICGEAGIGKTTLVALLEERARSADVLVLRGSCDALQTPRPLGPLLDIARAAGGHLGAMAEGEPRRERLFSGLLNLLQRTRSAAILVIEDVHWADFATLDLLTFLGRRIRDTAALLVVTYRDDELGSEHPLRHVLAMLPRDVTRRLPLPRLSRSAVSELAKLADRSAGDLFDLTSGNPFYVSEVLASPADHVPPSVQDAVFARTRSLDVAARDILDVVALAPGHLERWLLDAVLAPDPGAIRACKECGVLVTEDGRLAFRHELARQAWLRVTDETRQRRLHARLFAELEHASVSRSPGSGGTVNDAARLVHHAAGAGDAGAVFRLAPLAAAEAARLGAHREAAAHYVAALHAAPDDVDPSERAALLEALGHESYLTGANDHAVSALREALEIRRRLGDARRESEGERWLARLAWFRGDDEAVQAHVAAAVDAAEPLGLTAELARAYNTRAQFLMNAELNGPAILWGERALEMARAMDDLDTEVHALITVGAARLNQGDPGGRHQLVEALEFARQHGLQDAEARALLNLGEIGANWRDVEHAHADIATAIRFCIERDMDPYALCGIGARALLRLWSGDWIEATRDAEVVLDHPRAPAVDRIPPLVVLGLLRARRGDPGAWEALNEAKNLAFPTGEQHRIAPVAAARAEVAWLEGDFERAAREVRTAFEMAEARDNPWIRGDLALWLWRAGALDQPYPEVAEPYARSLAGDASAAAEAWDRLGFPYERALALVECEDEASSRDALRILQELGATRTAARVAADLRLRGVRHLPRGPRRATRENPAGLTRRQFDVLGLLAEGCANQTIAECLHISPKTVEHHVSAILAKLGVESRTEAALRAIEMGLGRPDHA